MINSMRKVRTTLILILLVAVLLPLSTLLIPMPAGFALGSKVYYETLVGTSLFAILYDGSAIMFVEGLKTFKPQLRHAYAFICLGIVFIGLNSMQYPIYGIFNLWTNGWYLQGGADIPYFVGSILIFLGARMFANVLKVRTRLLSMRLMIAVIIVAGIVTFIVSRLLGRELSPFDMHLILSTMSVVPFVLATFGVLKIKKSAGPAYTGPLAWFFLALLCTTIGSVLVATYDYLGITKDIILALPEILASTILLKAAYTFNKISLY